MRLPVRWLVLAIAILAPGTHSALGQDPIDTVPSASAEDVQAPEATPAGTFQGLPRRAPEPRTLHEFGAVFAIFAVTWLGIVGYVLRFGGPLDRITEKMRVAEQRGQS